MAAKLLFTPLSIGGGLLAGLLGKKVFEQIWGLIDKEEPPHPEHREISVPKMLIALAIEGAIFRMTKGALDHGHGAPSSGSPAPGRARKSPSPSTSADRPVTKQRARGRPVGPVRGIVAAARARSPGFLLPTAAAPDRR